MPAPANVLEFPPRSVRPPETRFEGGWVRDCRRADSVLTDQVHIAFWKYLCRNAARHQDARPLAGREVHLGEGQIAVNLRQAARDFRMSHKEIRLLISKLVRGSRIEIQPIKGAQHGHSTGTARAQGGYVGVLITICNYAAYQGPAKSEGTATPQRGLNANKQDSKKEEGRNKKGSESGVETEANTETPDGVADAPQLDAIYYARGKAILGKNAGGQLTKLKQALGLGRALEEIDKAGRQRQNAAEYIAAIIHRRSDRLDEPWGLYT